MYKVIFTQEAAEEFLGVGKVMQNKIAEKLSSLRSENFINDKALGGVYTMKFRKEVGGYKITYLRESDYLLITFIRIDY